MSTQALPFQRWIIRGATESPVSVTATRAAATMAYSAMSASGWERAGVDSNLPPHKYDQGGPLETYDAYKYCGGYDGATARQMAYCGAVCYSVPLPAYAAPGSSTAYAMSELSATVYGDRWLGDGSRIDVFLTDSPTPPAWADVVAGTGRVATTGDPAAASAASPSYGPPLQCVVRSNSGADTSSTVAIALSGVESSGAAQYLHAVLRLGDYTNVPSISKNGAMVDSAWIEGSAALIGASMTGVFSVAVEFPATAGASLSGVPMSLGAKYNSHATERTAFMRGFPIATKGVFRIVASNATYGQMSAASDDEKAEFALSMLFSAAAAYDTEAEDSVHSATSDFFVDPVIALTPNNVVCAAAVFQAVTRGGTFLRLLFPTPLDIGAAFRVVAYGIREIPVYAGKFGATPTADGFHFRGILPTLRNLFSADVRGGSATALAYHTRISGGSSNNPFAFSERAVASADTAPDIESATIEAVPLGAVDCHDGELSEIKFRSPFRTGDTAALCLFAIPLARTGNGTATDTVVVCMRCMPIVTYRSSGTAIKAAVDPNGANYYKFTEGFPASGETLTDTFNVRLRRYFSATIDGVLYEGQYEPLSSQQMSVTLSNLETEIDFVTKNGLDVAGKLTDVVDATVVVPSMSRSVTLRSASGLEFTISMSVFGSPEIGFLIAAAGIATRNAAEPYDLIAGGTDYVYDNEDYKEVSVEAPAFSTVPVDFGIPVLSRR